MNKLQCPVCNSHHTVKNGKRNGIQTYKCAACGYQFRSDKLPSDAQLWYLYLERKQTIAELAETFQTSESTIKRRLQNVSIEWVQLPIKGSGYVHIDVTYWGHNWGVLLAIDDATGFPLYVAFIKNETVEDYKQAVKSIDARGYEIRGLIIDGKKALFSEFSHLKIQMCQFHMKQIVRRYLTLNPRLRASRALKELVDKLTILPKQEFEDAYNEWKRIWHSTLYRRSKLKDGTTPFRHKKLRSAMLSLNFYLPYLFTFQDPQCVGMPNTNNKIEGTFTDLKKNLNNQVYVTF